jgi:hypothetical protein
MVQYLGNTLDEFPGPANQTWCFVHTVNLIAKSILKSLDVQKIKDICEFNDVTQALADLADGHNLEDEEGDEDEDEDEEEELDTSSQVGPMRLMLLKACQCFIVSLPKLTDNC